METVLYKNILHLLSEYAIEYMNHTYYPRWKQLLKKQWSRINIDPCNQKTKDMMGQKIFVHGKGIQWIIQKQNEFCSVFIENEIYSRLYDNDLVWCVFVSVQGVGFAPLFVVSSNVNPDGQ